MTDLFVRRFSEVSRALKLARIEGSGPSGYKRLLMRSFIAFCGSVRREKPKKCCLLLHAGRSGSTVLGKVLDAQPGLYWDGEVLSKAHVGTKGEAYKRLVSDKVARANWYKGRSIRCNGGIFGFELKYSQLSLMGSSPLIEVENFEDVPVLFVLLQRKNSLRRLLSIAHGMNTGEWHKGSPSSSRTLICVDNIFNWGCTLHEWLLKERNDFNGAYSAICGQGASYLRLSFEDDILPDPNIAARKVCDFIGLDMAFYRNLPGLKRDVSYLPLESLILNFGEVKNHLSGTDFDVLLTD